MKLKSSKIGPFRLYSKGYTGQLKIPLRQLKFSLEGLSEVLLIADHPFIATKKIRRSISDRFQKLKDGVRCDSILARQTVHLRRFSDGRRIQKS